MEEDTADDHPPTGYPQLIPRGDVSGQKRARTGSEDITASEDGVIETVLLHTGGGNGKPEDSYRNRLMHTLVASNPELEEEEDSFDDGFFSDDDCYIEEHGGPVIMLSKEDKQRIRMPWKSTLIVKLLGRSISYTYLCNRIKQLWSLKCSFDVVDMDNGFYCIRFGSRADYNHVLTNGPWLIADHYLTVRRWKPGFRSEEATIDTVAAWVRFPGMPLEYYDEDIMRMMGNKIGRSVRVDRTTSNMMRGKFARMCVELDLMKPLVSKIFIGGRWQRIEYEGLRMLCFHCGKFGHSNLECEDRIREGEGHSGEKAERPEAINKVVEKEYENVKFGPWMIAKKRSKRPVSTWQEGNGKQPGKAVFNDRGDSKGTGSRYAALGEEDKAFEDVDVVPNSLDIKNGDLNNGEGSSTNSKRVSKVQNKETLRKNLQASAMISNKGVSIGDVTTKSVIVQPVKVAASKNVLQNKGTVVSGRGPALKDVSNVISNSSVRETSCALTGEVIIKQSKSHTNDPLLHGYTAANVFREDILTKALVNEMTEDMEGVCQEMIERGMEVEDLSSDDMHA
ncbi:hypothetical protein REPUB_Repub02eG0097000 [Reevesia pubescens]